jgi:hypothetical protein
MARVVNDECQNTPIVCEKVLYGTVARMAKHQQYEILLGVIIGGENIAICIPQNCSGLCRLLGRSLPRVIQQTAIN